MLKTVYFLEKTKKSTPGLRLEPLLASGGWGIRPQTPRCYSLYYNFAKVHF